MTEAEALAVLADSGITTKGKGRVREPRGSEGNVGPNRGILGDESPAGIARRKRSRKRSGAWIMPGEKPIDKRESYPDPTEALIQLIEPLEPGQPVSAEGRLQRNCLIRAAECSNDRKGYRAFSIKQDGTVVERKRR